MNRIIKEREGEVWAIAGGKGGTGKTFITSSLGTFLARKGNRVVLIDVDLGGANLHSFLGISRPEKSLTSFFEMKSPLSELIVKTGTKNLYLITGNIHSLTSDSIKYTQKLKLFRHILKLNTQYILIDLGGGSNNNTLDTFLMADKMIAVLVPEITSVENMYHFIKNALFRKLRMWSKTYDFREIVEHVWNRRKEYKIKSMREYIDYLKDAFSYIGDVLEKEMSNFKIYLILNLVRSHQDILVGLSMKSTLVKYLGVNTQFVGYLEYDDTIWRTIRERRPFLQNYLSSRCSKEIEAFAENLIQGKEMRFLRV